MTNADPLMDVGQATEYLTVSRATFYREVQRKRILIVKVRGSTRVRKSELDRYLRDQERVA